MARNREGADAAGRARLQALSVRAALPEALHHQRRMAALLAELERSVPRGSFAWEAPSGRRLDALDLVRADLLQSGGATIGFVELLGAAPDLGPDEQHLSVPLHLPELRRAARIARRRGVPVSVSSSDSVRSRARIGFHTWVKLGRALRDASGRSVVATTDVPDVLLVAQAPHHVGDLEAVARHSVDVFGRSVGFLAADRPTAQAVGEAGFPVVRPPRVGWLRLGAILADAGRIWLRARRATRRLARRQGTAEAAAFAATVSAVVAEQLPRTLLVADDADAAIGPVLPRAVVVANPYTRAGRTAGRLALEASTPVIAVEHGSIFPDDPRWDGCPATVVCAWGEPSRRALRSCGVPDDHIVVTGAPRFDADTTVGAAAPRVRSGGASVLVATSGPGDHVSLDVHLRVVDLLARAVAATPEIAWTVKLHPKDRVEHYDAVVAHPNATIVAGDRARRASIFDHLAQADLLVTVSSTTALDALRARVPVVAVWLTEDEPPEFVARTAARVVADPDALVAAARAAASDELDPPDAAYLPEHFAGDGDATERVVAVVEASMRVRSG